MSNVRGGNDDGDIRSGGHLCDPIHDFGRHSWNQWVLHYAKGPWYLAPALYTATGSIEVAKATSAIAPCVTLLVIHADQVTAARLQALPHWQWSAEP